MATREIFFCQIVLKLLLTYRKHSCEFLDTLFVNRSHVSACFPQIFRSLFALERCDQVEQGRKKGKGGVEGVDIRMLAVADVEQETCCHGNVDELLKWLRERGGAARTRKRGRWMLCLFTTTKTGGFYTGRVSGPR